ncbi:HAMP domain-containing protein [Paenibacillus sp. LMG 31461]|uniref:HAMP domain-containing protein n=1 Tax=Paenibacillus plantarum TaxID=2654975 RepID=A0ABX1X8T6_9BACL|nr:sensor histidine kinase [Paenibacillus plantarum]NOU64852.1 HAMP domain-containing protein [Paenibacillus plantarum]
MSKQTRTNLTEFLKFIKSLLHYSSSIQAKIFITFSIIVLLSIAAISVTTYLNFSRTIEKNAIIYVSDSVKHANDNFELILEDIQKISTVIVTNKPNVIDAITSSNDPVSLEGFREKQETENFLLSLIAYKASISRIAIIGLNGKIFNTGGSLIFNSILDQPWFESASSSKDKQILIDAPAVGSVSFTRIIRQNNRPVGVVIIDFDKITIEQMFAINPVEGSLLYVADPLGNFIFQPEHAQMQTTLQNSPLSPFYTSVEPLTSLSSSVFDLNNHRYLAVRYHSNITGWLTLGLIPYNALLKDASRVRSQIGQIVALVIFAVLLVSIALSRQITKNIKHLSFTMKKVREGNLHARPHVVSKDEIGGLSEGFNLMMNNITTLMKEIKIQEQGKREAELYALQAQIRPHFIYNTLGTIKNLARMQNVKNVEELLGSFIELLRMTLGHTKEIITIREELDYLKSYIHIQKYKYLDRITVILLAEDDILECQTLKLVLQPILENAMIHALGQSDKNLFITVRIYSELNRVKFEVTDNGIGMTPEQIDRVLESSEHDESFNGIGMKNVNERIRRTFGNEYGIAIFSEVGMYTTVEFTIPEMRISSKT